MLSCSYVLSISNEPISNFLSISVNAAYVIDFDSLLATQSSSDIKNTETSIDHLHAKRQAENMFIQGSKEIAVGHSVGGAPGLSGEGFEAGGVGQGFHKRSYKQRCKV
ncbi:hypothetical protein L2E82_51225 [Cichorium intybus]|nr:hypothetical protein L2E82_51225 [Cichorium intybus]